MIKTNVQEFIDELGAGAFKEKLAVALSEVAMSTAMHGTKAVTGKLSLEFVFHKIGDNDQVIISHKLGISQPTRRGRKTEEDTTQTPMFVGKGGMLTVDQPKEDNNGQFSLTAVSNNKD